MLDKAELQLKRIVLGIQYDGAQWHGWQTQSAGNTVQDKLEEALSRFACTRIDTVCAGRTDTGVHAIEQVIHFDTAVDREMFSWVRGVNTFLPSSIAVRWAHPVSPDPLGDFHARFSATGRTYQYFLYNHPVRSPLLVGKAGWVFRPLEIEPMRIAAKHLIGTHDFSAFRSSECQAKSPIRIMREIDIQKSGSVIVFTLHANAFLHHMVRNIVGSLIFTGSGSRPPDWIADVLGGKDRSRAAPTFMPDGLYLAKIDYDSKWGLPQEPGSVMPWAD
jgi:tRNA pseudouridine38-40 synthase